jgi:3-oxoacyl-(acyl-carrier-protein) synthase
MNVSDSMINNEKIILVQDNAKSAEINVALSNSFGFAGNVASIVVQKLMN